MGRWTEGVRRAQLPNGLTVLAQAQSAAPAAAVVTHVKAGFFDEPDRWGGVSHVLEHMFFKGTPTRGVGQIAQETKAAGGYLNAGTSYDYTTYYVVLPAASLETALDIQADALQHSVIDADELARELQVIIQEAKRKRDSPGAVATETLFQIMYDHHRIRRWRIGHEDHLAQLTRDDVWQYYRSRYVPRNTIVAIVGDIDPDEALAMARTRYRDWPDDSPAVDRSPAELPRREVRVRTLRGDVAQGRLMLGWRTVPPQHPDEAALELAAAVLSAGRGSWLYRLLRAPGVVSAVSAYTFAPTELGLFGVGMELAPDRIAPALDGLGHALDRLVNDGPGASDLERARTLLLTRWARGLEPTDGRASALAAAEALRDVHLLDEEFQRLQETTAEEIREAVQRWIDPQSVSAVSYLPEEQGADLDVADVAARLGYGAGTPLTVLPDIPVKVPPSIRVTLAGDDMVQLVSLDGVDVIVRPKRDVPTITLGVYGPRDPSETLDTAGLGALAVRSAVRGVGPYGAGSVAAAFERRGGAVGVHLSGERFGFRCTVLADEAPAAATLLRRLFEDPSFATEEVDRERAVMIEEARQRTDDMFGYPFQLAFGAAFHDTGYGVPMGGTPQSLARFDAGRAQDEFRRLTNGKRLTVVAVGDAEPQALAEQIAAVFEDYAAAPSNTGPEPASYAVDTSAAARMEQRDKAQTALAMVFPGPGRRDDDRFAAEVWAAVAGGLGGRLFEILRSQQSLAYTVVASSWQRRGAGALLAYVATSPEREEEARDGLHRELQRFATESVSDDELSRAVNYLAGQREIARQTSSAVMDEILDAWFSGNGLAELVDPWHRYRPVTVDDVSAVCHRAFAGGRCAEGIVRGRTVEGTPAR